MLEVDGVVLLVHYRSTLVKNARNLFLPSQATRCPKPSPPKLYIAPPNCIVIPSQTNTLPSQSVLLSPPKQTHCPPKLCIVISSQTNTLPSQTVLFNPLPSYTASGVSNWNYADPLCTFLFAILVLFTTKGTAQRILSSVMFKVPKSLSVPKIKRCLENIKDVLCVHDLHVWAVGEMPVFTCHLRRAV